MFRKFFCGLTSEIRKYQFLEKLTNTSYCDDVTDPKRSLFSCREMSFSASNNAGGYAESFIENNIKYSLYFIDFSWSEEKSIRVGDLT